MVHYNGHALVEGSVLVGRTFKIYPFSVESGFFLILPRRHCLSKMSKITQILYILSGPCMVYSKRWFSLRFSSTKSKLYALFPQTISAQPKFPKIFVIL